jgi:hypothetical protein
MVTLAHPASTPFAAQHAVEDRDAPRPSGFGLIVPLGAIYLALLVIGPFLAMAFHH